MDLSADNNLNTDNLSGETNNGFEQNESNVSELGERRLYAFDKDAVLNKIEALKDSVGKVIVGQEKVVDMILASVLADGHVLLEGVPGVAKTLTARLISKLIGSTFSRIQFTADLMPSDVLGTNVFNVKTSEFEFHKGPAFGDIVLADEINRAPAKTQSALFEVMEERQTTIDGVCYQMGDIYTILATQNPVEQEGTYRLPEAQMDRFLVKINIGYPSLEEEIDVLKRHDKNKKFTKLENVSAAITKEELLMLRDCMHSVRVEPSMMAYIAQIVQSTRNHKNIYLGASPRASVALMRMAKANALMNGRDFVAPDDVKAMAIPVLEHRVTLSTETEMEGHSVVEVLKKLVEDVDVPK